MEKVKVKIYKPFKDKQGNTLDVETIAQIERLLLRNAGGFTLSSINYGAWIGKVDERVDDIIHIYEMIVDNNPSIIANLRAQALVIKQEMQQDCVLFTVEPMLEVEFVE